MSLVPCLMAEFCREVNADLKLKADEFLVSAPECTGCSHDSDDQPAPFDDLLGSIECGAYQDCGKVDHHELIS